MRSADWLGARAVRALLCVWACFGCAASVPSVSRGTSASLLGSSGALPQRIALRCETIQHYDPVGDAFRTGLPELGFLLVEEGADAHLVARIETSDFSPVHLNVTMQDADSGRVLWSAEVVRKWDLYASIVSATESNANAALELLRRDLAAAAVRQ